MAEETLDTTPIDASEVKPCRFCGKPLLESGTPVFYEATWVSCVADLGEVRRLAGLEQMLGSPALARAMAPSTTIGHRVGQPARHFICSPCAATRSIVPLELMEESVG